MSIRIGNRSPCRCLFVPPHILDHIAKVTAVSDAKPHPATLTAAASKQLRDQRRRAVVDLVALTAAQEGQARRVVFDCDRGVDFDAARKVRGEGDPPVGRPESADAAYDSVGAVLEYYSKVLRRNSLDDLGLDINAYVNYGENFDNAFWDGSHIVLGTGDGEIFTDFSQSREVMGHELAHGVVEHTANLEYNGQSGALNEHFADVFGSLADQHSQGLTAQSANWLIGDEIMAPGLYGEALRSMAHPGTAYDNPLKGRDPQPSHMQDYYAGPLDNQGVHRNSGIPNRAFYLTAAEIGADEAGLIWYQGLLNLWPTATFPDAATVISAQARILVRDKVVTHRNGVQVVRSAFRAVGIL
ncbi:M4 family metallopeptidase [Streptomyces cinnamoneus]|uniref:M4 family metallopeptidase n=1 Tax=Streptomyces cinnamoneus TaxID=53446 RepID=UPI00343077FA